MNGVESRRVVIVDDSPVQCARWQQLLQERYGARAAVETYTDPVAAVSHLGDDIHVMLLDWEMPGLSGEQVVEEARRRGVNLKRVIITSARPAEELHQVFDSLGCLAVIEKGEPQQQAAFLMILDSLMRR